MFLPEIREKILTETHRTLKKDGIGRIVIPLVQSPCRSSNKTILCSVIQIGSLFNHPCYMRALRGATLDLGTALPKKRHAKTEVSPMETPLLAFRLFRSRTMFDELRVFSKARS
jgi:hypothetical protein